MTTSRFGSALAVLFALLLYLALPSRLTLGPGWVLSLFEGVLLIGLAISTPYRHHTQSPVRRRLSIGLIALVTAANFVALDLFVHLLLERNTAAGRDMMIAAGADLAEERGGLRSLVLGGRPRQAPHADRSDPEEPDFAYFPQMTVPEMPFGNWRPGFMDYLYVAFTNASACQPDHAKPLTVRVKSLIWSRR